MSIYVNRGLFLFSHPLFSYQKLTELPDYVMTYNKTKNLLSNYLSMTEIQGKFNETIKTPCMVIRNLKTALGVDDRPRLKTGESLMFGIHKNK